MATVPLSVSVGWFSLELLYAVAFLLGTVEVLWGVTADFSVLPSLVEEHELTTANAAYLGADRGARVIGPLLGGTTIAALGGGIAPTPPRSGSRPSPSCRNSWCSCSCPRCWNPLS